MGNGISIRPGTPTDSSRLLDIHRSAILVTGRSAYSQAECESWAWGLKPRGYANAMRGGGETYLVAEISNLVIGFCSFKADEVAGLYVAPEAGRRGAGSALLKRAEDGIAAQGYTDIRIGAALSALEFYKRHGYEAVRFRNWKTRGGLLMKACDLRKALIQTA